MEDLYFNIKYGRLYEAIEGGMCEEFIFRHELGTIHHLFIKRKIPIDIQGSHYYDLTTPYGYGGPVITKLFDTERKEELVFHFCQTFQAYCLEQNIVSEFVRFHPIINNAADFNSCYSIRFRRYTTGITLKGFEDPVQEEFSSSTRKRIRKALKDGVTWRVTVHPPDLEQFKIIYKKTMERIGANELYFFNDAYFSDILDYFGDQLILVEALFDSQIIGAEIHFLSGPVIHTHLSGTLNDFSHLSPVYVMTYAIAQWGKEHNVDLIHSGGGITTAPDDSLYLFKKKFGKNTEFDYHIGDKIWNEKIYRQLVKLKENDNHTKLFPAYR
ncbi:GNAT family N-acetyltransferase [Planococcus sp. APC 3900]|uniref:GNAT family N-acetyltransferase n=1 Tax=Planococcus sp. APC 3900 TaxID=3035191 RepID=UPI0025B61EA0|nr:GNAT family N-acetyltransferase [Planococcus sp. APC 3900]MDN3437349.1 GNAT family N-acetyltransferase [Planococcus sp. APC 3900]